MSGNQFNISTPMDTRELVVEQGVAGDSTHPPPQKKIAINSRITSSSSKKDLVF